MTYFRLNPIYQQAHSMGENLINGKGKSAAKNLATVYELGKTNPAQAKLLSRVASRDLAFESKKNLITPLRMLVTAFKVNFIYSKKYNAEKKALDETYKQLYPKTHKIRDKFIKNGKVKYQS